MEPLAEPTTEVVAPEPAATPVASPEVPRAASRKPLRAPEPFSYLLQSLLGTVVIAIFVIAFAVQAFQIPSESMEKTLLIGDYVLVDKMHYGGGDSPLAPVMPYRDIKRGDIIVFRYPVHPSEHFVKRVVGMQGDRIRLVDKKLYVNGTLLTEPYVQHLPGSDAWRDNFPRLDFTSTGVDAHWSKEMAGLVRNGQLVVPEGQYFVMGDNRDQSSDSRYWGFVPRENVVGRPLLVYWSLRKLDDDDPPAHTLTDKLMHLAYVILKIPQTARWERSLSLIR